MNNQQNNNDTLSEEQIKEITGEKETLEEMDEDRVMGTQDTSDKDPDDFKPQEVEELIDQEEDRRRRREED